MKKKILIVTKHPESKGGVVNYYNHFFKVFDNPKYELQWFTVGSRPKDYHKRRNRSFSYGLDLLRDIFSFLFLMIRDRRIRIVQVNPSFIKVPLLRDSIFVFIAKLFRKKTIVFIRGWSDEFATQLKKSKGAFNFVFRILKKSDVILVLAHKFKESLVDLGFISENIAVTRTMYRNSDIRHAGNFMNKNLKFLYIGRLSEPKGVLDIIEAFKIIKEKNIDLSIDLYGHFSSKDIEEQIITLIDKYQLENTVRVNGFISGEDKYKILSESDVFVFPSYHEGCPNSVIEALAASLFIIATPVGAVDEIVENDKHGIIVPVNTPDLLAEKIIWSNNNFDIIKARALKNGPYALSNFEQEVIMTNLNYFYNNLY
ncbi:MAG: glycosyltransferase family 4 protein [Bacteroidota bacterium]